MVRIAVVEDERECREQLAACLKRFKQESGEAFSMTLFENGEDFLENYQKDFDILILDIQLTGMDGMELAKAVREQDEAVIILFITAMAQYAIQGYTVNAMSYILKPIPYFVFSENLHKALRRIREEREGFLIARTREGMLHIPFRSIAYIETQGRRVAVHTEGAVHTCAMKMRELEAMLPQRHFYRCHNCYIVNLRYVESVGLNEATVNRERVSVSRLKKEEFMQMLASYGGSAWGHR